MEEQFLPKRSGWRFSRCKTAAGPFGAVIVRKGRIIAWGTNRVTFANDPTAHAEIVAIREACADLGDFRLSGCVLYSSCEPCPMCLGRLLIGRGFRNRVSPAAKPMPPPPGLTMRFCIGNCRCPKNSENCPLRQMLAAEGQRPFAAWKQFTGKIEY